MTPEKASREMESRETPPRDGFKGQRPSSLDSQAAGQGMKGERDSAQHAVLAGPMHITPGHKIASAYAADSAGLAGRAIAVLHEVFSPDVTGVEGDSDGDCDTAVSCHPGRSTLPSSPGLNANHELIRLLGEWEKSCPDENKAAV